MRNRSIIQSRPVLLLAFIAFGTVVAIAGRTGALQTSPTGPAAAASQPGATHLSPTRIAGIAQVATTTSTPVPTPTTPPPTATAIPPPVKMTNVAPPPVGAISAVVVDEASGAVLYGKEEHVARAPASITKIVAAIVALQRGRLGDLVTVRYDPAELVDSTVMGVYPGDQLTLLDLLYGLMLPSGNDAALAIANHIAGSKAAFAALMNAEMDDLGLHDSHFVNPHGLDAKGHYTSAYDIVMVARQAMRNPTFRELAAARLHDVSVTTPKGINSYTVYNLNRLLSEYKGGDGVKLGYTEDALHTIVGSATRNGHRVYAGVMGSQNLWVDTPPLLDYAFKNFQWPDSGR